MTRFPAVALLISSAAWLAQAQPSDRGAVIAGRVVDEFGDAVISARVVAETPGEPPPLVEGQKRTLTLRATP